jgi:hypothetical protein
MAWIDGYEAVEPTDKSPGAAPGTEETNEARRSPGPGWSKGTTEGCRPGNPSGGGVGGTPEREPDTGP